MGWLIDSNQGNWAALARGRSPWSVSVAPRSPAPSPAVGQFSRPDQFLIIARDTPPPRCPGERFCEGVSVSRADITTCYPGHSLLRASANHGDVCNRQKVGKPARPIYQTAGIGQEFERDTRRFPESQREGQRSWEPARPVYASAGSPLWPAGALPDTCWLFAPQLPAPVVSALVSAPAPLAESNCGYCARLTVW